MVLVAIIEYAVKSRIYSAYEDILLKNTFSMPQALQYYFRFSNLFYTIKLLKQNQDSTCIWTKTVRTSLKKMLISYKIWIYSSAFRTCDILRMTNLLFGYQKVQIEIFLR